MTGAFVIRPVRAEDEAVVGQIAFQTGFFGDSAARYFPAQRLFALLWVGPYFRGAGQAGCVAEQGGRVVGYVLGAPEPGLYRRALWRVISAGFWRARPTLSPLFRCLTYVGRAARFPSVHADWAAYPAHLHLNLLPEARGHHLGERLLRTHLAALTDAGIPGVQLSTTTENRAALGLYRKLGFHVVTERQTALWTPWLGRPTTQVVLACALSPSQGMAGDRPTTASLASPTDTQR